MVLHPWERLPDLANMLGLMLGAFGIYLAGNNKITKVIAIITIAIFMSLFLVYFYLFWRDYFALLPSFTKKFLGIVPY